MQGLKNLFMAHHGELRALDLCNAMYGLAALDDYTIRMRPPIPVMKEITEGLVSRVHQLKMFHISLVIYAFGK